MTTLIVANMTGFVAVPQADLARALRRMKDGRYKFRREYMVERILAADRNVRNFSAELRRSFFEAARSHFTAKRRLPVTITHGDETFVVVTILPKRETFTLPKELVPTADRAGAAATDRMLTAEMSNSGEPDEDGDVAA